LDRDCLLLFSARYGLYHAIPALGLRPGDGVLVPSYCCGTEIDPLLARQLELEWYAVGEDTQVDFEDLERRWHPKVKALLVTHYLGFDRLTDQIIQFCRDKGMVLIEDCAHAFLSVSEEGEPLGSRGDAAIFSMRKTLPCPDGGALVLNEPRRSDAKVKLRAPNPWAIFFRNCELLELNTTRSSRWPDRIASTTTKLLGMTMAQGKLPFRAARKFLHLGSDCLVHPNSYTFVRSVTEWRASAFSRRRLKSTDWLSAIEHRRKNFQFLLSALDASDETKPLMRELPQGISPLFFPLLVKERDRLRNLLCDQGVDSHAWWGYFHPQVPWAEFPAATRLKQELLGLPVHQGLTPYHMEVIADKVLTARDRL
jgi:dTDP-4-amino-4,6-dideoxygalactose transaminase